MNQESRRCPEGNQVSQGIKFTAERTFNAAHSGHTTIEQIKNTGQQNEAKGKLDGAVLAVGDISFDDLCQRHEPAEEIAGRKQVRKKVDLEPGLGSLAGQRRDLGVGRHVIDAMAWISRKWR